MISETEQEYIHVLHLFLGPVFPSHEPKGKAFLAGASAWFCSFFVYVKCSYVFDLHISYSCMFEKIVGHKKIKDIRHENYNLQVCFKPLTCFRYKCLY